MIRLLPSFCAKAVLAVLIASLPAFVAAAELTGLSLSETGAYSRAEFALSGPTEYKVFTLANPDRLVVDLQESRLAPGYREASPTGPVALVRTGSPGAGALRVVFDLATAVRPKTFLLTPAAGVGHRLVIELHSDAAPSTAKTVQDMVPDTGRDVLIAVDAGHGGQDPGARGAKGTWEKQITLSVARELARQINAEPGLKTILIRDGDDFIPLQQRYRKAREAKADLFVSIHADAFNKPSASGASVFVMSQRGASSEAARWLADRENAADLVGGVTLDDKDNTLAKVLLDLSQSATMKASEDVAENVLSALKRVVRTHKPQVERANFVVLRSPDVPSLLVETAFISNPGEEKKLNDPAHRQRLSAAILAGVRNYFTARPLPGTWLAAQQGRHRASEHLVSRGDTLSGIANRHEVSVASLRLENRLQSDVLRIGQRLRIPPLAIGAPGIAAAGMASPSPR
jgi:N-acetylmuramoyl-L-alanine amidase